MAKQVSMLVRQQPKIVSRFSSDALHYEQIKHLIRPHNLFTWFVCLFMQSELVMLPPEMCSCVDGVTGMGIGHVKCYNGHYYGLWTEGFPEY